MTSVMLKADQSTAEFRFDGTSCKVVLTDWIPSPDWSEAHPQRSTLQTDRAKGEAMIQHFLDQGFTHGRI